jgi:hypothetical protein
MAPSLESSSSLIWPIVAVVLVLAASAGSGGLVVWPSGRGKRRILQLPLLSIAIGLNLLGFVGIVLGVARLLSGSNSIWLLVGLVLIGAIAAAGGKLARGTSGWRLDRGAPGPSLVPAILVGGLLIGGVTVGPALCPPTGWDELVYHHVLPRRWQADGWPAFYADLPYSGFPSLGEILFWLMAPLDSLIASHLLTWTCWAIGCLLLYGLLRRRLAAVSAAVLVAALALGSTSLLTSANCYVETIQFMNFAALLLVIDDRRAAVESPWQSAAAIGVLAGGAAAVKLTGLAIVSTAGLWYLVSWFYRRHHAPRDAFLTRSRPALRVPRTTMLVATCVALPFYLRPWWLTGNPFYPYYGDWFSSDPARVEVSRYHHALGSRFGDHSPGSLIVNLVRLAFDYQPFDGDFGWQWLMVIALAIVGFVWTRRRRTPFMIFASVAFGWLYLFWFFTAQQARFALPAALAVMPLAALGLRRLHGTRRRLVLVLLLAAVIFSAPWRTAGRYVGSWMTVAGIIKPADYMKISIDTNEVKYTELVQATFEHTHPDARLMLFFEHRSYYLPRFCVIGTPFFQEQWFTPTEPFADPARFMEVLARERITHVVMPDRPTGPDRADAWDDRLAPFLAGIQTCVDQGKLKVVWRSERYILFSVHQE